MVDETDDEPATGDDPEGRNSPQDRHEPSRTAKGTGRKGADEALALALAAGKTLLQAAAAAGVSESTALRRQREPAFAARVRELRSAMVSAAAGRLADGMTDAADVLRELLASENEAIRLRAADRILEVSLKVTELVELQQRVEQLEARLGGEGKS